MAGRIERVAAQRARRTPGPDDAERALDEGSGRVRGEPDAQEVGAVLVVVIELDDALGLRLCLDVFVIVLLARRPRLDQDLPGVDVPAEGQRRRPERLVERLVERLLIGLDRGRRGP